MGFGEFAPFVPSAARLFEVVPEEARRLHVHT